MERKFSDMYSKLVEDNDDMIGHIAYSLYKSRKITYIQSFIESNANKRPSESDLESFHKSADTMIISLRIEAEQILTNFTQFLLDETVNDIAQQLIENQEDKLIEIITPIIPKSKGPWDGFWMSVLVKGAQTLVVAAIFFLVIFFYSAKDDFWGTIREIIPESQKKELKKDHENPMNVDSTIHRIEK